MRERAACILLSALLCLPAVAAGRKKPKAPDQKPRAEWIALPQGEQQEAVHYVQDFVQQRGSNLQILGLRAEAVSPRLAFLHDEMGTKFFLVVRDSFVHLVSERILAFTIGSRYGSVSRPAPFKKMIQKYDSLLVWMSRGVLPPEASLETKQASARVVPLLRQIAWRQFGLHDVFVGQTAPVVSGCGAVALGQVMYFHRFPEVAHGTCQYETDEGKRICAEMEGVKLGWDGLKDSYSWHDRDTLTLAPLIRMCGIALHSVYGTKTTLTKMKYYREALTQHFGYAETARLVGGIAEGELAEYVRHEVEAGRPCILCDNQHIFVADGVFDEYLHFNLGWGGVANGWFRLITPTTKMGEHTFLVSGVVGIQPAK